MIGTTILRLVMFILAGMLYEVIAIQEDKHEKVEDIHIQFDWRERGVISPVSNQGKIMSALVFTKREEVESMYAIHHKKLVPLSTNQVADCCDNINPSFDCIQKLGGLCSAEDYGKLKGFCPPVNCTQYGKIERTVTLPSQDEESMIRAIHVNPLLAYINAGLESFQTYVTGIYADPKCRSSGLDHVVQIVGYGIDGKGNKFWLIKNSWGENWGNTGFMYLQRGRDMCGISRMVLFPVEAQDSL